MLVARSFSPPSSSHLSEKSDASRLSSRSLRQRSQSPQRFTTSPTRNKATQSLRTAPVQIPSRNEKHSEKPSGKKQHEDELPRSAPIAVQSRPTTIDKIPSFRPKGESAKDILSATAIPIRRRRARPSQRLPQGDHVTDFSRFLLDDLYSGKDGALPRTQSLPQIDGLFGNIDELVDGQVIIGSDPRDDSCLSARSISSDSLASMASPDDYSTSHAEIRSSIGRSPQGRIVPRIVLAEACARDHPLADLEEIESISLKSADSPSPSTSPSSRTTSPTPKSPKKETTRSSFKSTLTSSLKAITSAARTTLMSSSGFGPHGGVGSPNPFANESLLAHSFFDIQPSLTDDRRPPPSMTRPSPELRRYLNPQMASAPSDSPTQLHFWQEERHAHNLKREKELIKQKVKEKRRRRHSPGPKSKIDALPSVVPLSTCLPPAVRTANASSPPIWLTPDGEPVNKHTSKSMIHEIDASSTSATGMPRTREPRENRDFLRMYVCEMGMRRSGKLSDDLSAGRAKLWLPPMANHASSGARSASKPAAERWKAVDVNSITVA